MKPTLTTSDINVFANLTLRRAIHNWQLWDKYKKSRGRAKDFATLRFVRFCIAIEDYRNMDRLKPSTIRRKKAQLERYFNGGNLTQEEFTEVSEAEVTYRMFALNHAAER